MRTANRLSPRKCAITLFSHTLMPRGCLRFIQSSFVRKLTSFSSSVPITVFSDGNKRIAAAMFLYFLDKNDALFLDEAKTEKAIADQTLAALTIMIAESQPAEKEMMISVIMNCMIE